MFNHYKSYPNAFNHFESIKNVLKRLNAIQIRMITPIQSTFQAKFCMLAR